MWGKLTGFLGGLFSGAGSAVLSGLARLANGAASAANDVWNEIQSLISGAIAGLSTLLDALHGAVSGAWSLLTGAFSALEHGFNELMSALWQTLSWIYKVGLPAIYREIDTLFSSIASLANNLGSFIAGQINSVLARLDKAIGDVITFAIQNIYTPLADELHTVSNVAGDLWSFIHGLLDDPRNFGKWLIFPLIDVIIEGSETIFLYAGKALVGLMMKSITAFPEIVEEIIAPLL